jgi:hypothetical protein
MPTGIIRCTSMWRPRCSAPSARPWTILKDKTLSIAMRFEHQATRQWFAANKNELAAKISASSGLPSPHDHAVHGARQPGPSRNGRSSRSDRRCRSERFNNRAIRRQGITLWPLKRKTPARETAVALKYDVTRLRRTARRRSSQRAKGFSRRKSRSSRSRTTFRYSARRCAGRTAGPGCR